MRIWHDEQHKTEEHRSKMSARLSLGLNAGGIYELDDLDDLAYLWQEKLCADLSFPFYEWEDDGNGAKRKRDLPATWHRDMYAIYALFEDDGWWNDFSERDDLDALGIQDAIKTWLTGVPAEDITA